MALTATASLVVTPDGNWNPDPTGASGWDNSSGDKTWVPDEYYYRRVLLELTGGPGEVPNIVRWEIYDGTTIPFVDDASAVTVQASLGDYTAATAPAYVNDRTTRTIWVRNATAADGGAPYYDNTGNAWVGILRANGPRNVIEFPAYLRWDVGVGPDSMTFEVEAFTGPGGLPSATTSITISKPDITLIGGETGTPFPRSAAESPEEEPEADVESQEPEPKQKQRKKRGKRDDTEGTG